MPIYALVVEKDGPKFQTYANAPHHGMNTSKQPTGEGWLYRMEPTFL